MKNQQSADAALKVMQDNYRLATEAKWNVVDLRFLAFCSLQQQVQVDGNEAPTAESTTEEQTP